MYFSLIGSGSDNGHWLGSKTAAIDQTAACRKPKSANQIGHSKLLLTYQLYAMHVSKVIYDSKKKNYLIKIWKQRTHTYIHQCSQQKRVNEHQKKKRKKQLHISAIESKRCELCVYCLACTYNDVCFEFRRSKSIFVFISKYAYNFSLETTTTKNGVTSSIDGRLCSVAVLYGVHKLFWPLIEFIDCSFLNITVFQISFWYAQCFSVVYLLCV